MFPDSEVANLVDAVPQRTLAPIAAMRLADGLIPPTSRWFSGLVFGDSPQPVFPLPLSFAVSATGFEFGVPAITSAPDSILGPHNPAIVVDIGADRSFVRAYDDASVTLSAVNAADEEIGTITIAQGSPVVTFTAARSVDAQLSGSYQQVTEGVWQATSGGDSYGLVTAAELTASVLSLSEGQSASWVAVPSGGDLSALAPRVSPLSSTRVSWSVTADAATTTLSYVSAGGTLVATMPHHRAALAPGTRCGLGDYRSVYGRMELCRTDSLSWSTPAVEPTANLDLSNLGDDDRALLRQQLAADLPDEAALAADTYFGGKALARLANLLEVALQLGADAEAAMLREKLGTALREWTDPTGCETRAERCFVYDPEGRGVIGVLPSFGSDEFNDHHFHYGYFLYAASVAARDDAALRDDIAPVINLLAADLATSGEASYFPNRRVFDVYAGHSWASGFSPFADGNNQESTSEAVNAWNGLALWAGVTGNEALADEARWMLSSEAASANSYWTNFDESDPVYAGFEHSITSLVWGGKRDYATWFSAEPNAKLAILLLPITPVSAYLATDAERVSRNLAEATAGGYDVQFGDYLLMYRALVDPAGALAVARTLPDERIDDGNSRTYLLAWILSRQG